MVPFPPAPWQSLTTALLLQCFGWFVIYLAVLGFLHRQRRRPEWYDAPLMLAIATLSSIVFGLPNENVLGHPTSGPVFQSLVWIALLIATVVNWKRLSKMERTTEMRASVGTLVCIMLLCSCVLWIAAQVPHARENARLSMCTGHLKQIALALHNYHDVAGQFPEQQLGQPAHSWRVAILPYIYESQLYNEYHFSDAWNEGTNDRIARREIATYQCPSEKFARSPAGYPYTAYVLFLDDEAVWRDSGPLTLDQLGSANANTLLFGEACGQRIPWSEPRDVVLSQATMRINAPGHRLGHSTGVFSSFHPRGACYSTVDGQIRVLSPNTAPQVLADLMRAQSNDDEEF